MLPERRRENHDSGDNRQAEKRKATKLEPRIYNARAGQYGDEFALLRVRLLDAGFEGPCLRPSASIGDHKANGSCALRLYFAAALL
jgi:hypothetical protein